MSGAVKTLAIIAFAAAVVAGIVAVPIWLIYRGIPPVTDRGFAYTFGVQLGLNSDHLHAIWEGKEPQIKFRSRRFDTNNSYVWQKATVRRPGQCLDLTDGKGASAKLSQLCSVTDKLEMSEIDFYFGVDAEKSIIVGTSDKPPPPEKNRIKPRGAMFGIEGHLGIGTRLESAYDFHIELTAQGVNVDDRTTAPIEQQGEAEGDEEVGGCGEPSLVRSYMFPFSVLPEVPARLCRFREKGGRILSIVQYQRNLLHHSRVATVAQCSALLNRMLRFDQPTDFGGCVGADWNKYNAMNVDFVLFTINGVRRTGLFR